MAKMECPICGKSFDDEMVEFLENGNPACPHCVDEEQKRQEKTNENE